MTTQTVFGKATFTVANPLTAFADFQVVDKVRGTPLLLPKGAVITEVEIQRSGSEALTAATAMQIGLVGNSSAVTGLNSVLTDDLNTDGEAGFGIIVEPISLAGIRRAVLADTPIILRGFGVNVTSGTVSLIIKYKAFSSGVASRYNVA